MAENLFLHVGQAYNGGFKYGMSLKLKDAEDNILATARGGGYNMESAVLRDWANARFKDELEARGITISDGSGVEGVEKALASLGWSLRKVKATDKLHIYELDKVKEDGDG